MYELEYEATLYLEIGASRFDVPDKRFFLPCIKTYQRKIEIFIRNFINMQQRIYCFSKPREFYWHRERAKKIMFCFCN